MSWLLKKAQSLSKAVDSVKEKVNNTADKIKDKANSAADKVKAKVQKYFPPDLLNLAITKLDSLSLRKARETTKRVLRDIRAKKDDALDAIIKKVNRRLDNVIRTGESAMRDLADLANEVDKAVNPTEENSVAAKFQNYKAEADEVADSGSRIVRSIKQLYPGLKDPQFQRILKSYQAKSDQVEQLMARFGRILNKIKGHEGAEAAGKE